MSMTELAEHLNLQNIMHRAKNELLPSPQEVTINEAYLDNLSGAIDDLLK